MSIKVTPNSDGSYTVNCDDVDVVVGEGKNKAPVQGSGNTSPDSGPAPGPIVWPDDPDSNGEGVYAYLFVGPPSATPEEDEAAVPRPRMLALESPYALSQVVRGALLEQPLRRATGASCLRVMLAAAPDQPLELEAFLQELRPIANSEGLRIELYIAVGAIVGLSSG